MVLGFILIFATGIALILYGLYRTGTEEDDYDPYAKPFGEV